MIRPKNNVSEIVYEMRQATLHVSAILPTGSGASLDMCRSKRWRERELPHFVFFRIHLLGSPTLPRDAKSGYDEDEK
jgi:hypothetical protein